MAKNYIREGDGTYTPILEDEDRPKLSLVDTVGLIVVLVLIVAGFAVMVLPYIISDMKGI